MKILIEEHAYDPEVLEGVLPEGRLNLTNDKYKVENVGYYRNTTAGHEDFVFFLPKVLLDANGRVFKIPNDPVLANGFSPEEIINPDLPTADGRCLAQEQKNFIYEFAVWIYRALAHYESTHQGTEAVWRQKSKEAGAFRSRYVTNTLLDVILALRRFARDNKDYFLFKIQEKHSGANKINWARTISRSAAIVQRGRPLYLNPLNKKKTIDFDEELLVLFYSILGYINDKFGFEVQIPMGYELIPPGEFERYLCGYGVSRLRQIKYKYFSDRDLKLWELCFAFFDKAHQANVVSDQEEYLLAKDFNLVFEAMIDDLIGDGELDEFKTMKDNKEIDHLYIDDSLTRSPDSEKKTFYIADSKYYGIGNSLGKNSSSVYKQFSYARRMLQLNLDLFLNDQDVAQKVKDRRKPFERKNVGLLRDDVTEGYDVIPNFFISAEMDQGFDYDKSGLKPHAGEDEYRNIHFANRLFDRDTLILTHYDVNFLYVLKLYAQNDSCIKSDWKREVRGIFQAKIREILSKRFKFHAIMPHDGVTKVEAEAFLRENFRKTLGKVFAPYNDVLGRPVYSYAVEKPEEMVFDPDVITQQGFDKLKADVAKENDSTEALLKKAFYVVPLDKLGEDPTEKLTDAASEAIEGIGDGGTLGGDVILTSEGKILEPKARWIYKHKMYFMEAGNYTKTIRPEEIRLISLAWMPPVTMIVGDCHANLRPSEISRLTGERWPFDGGVYHVWSGTLVNCEKWDEKFGPRNV